jgi:hypothetical protein
MSPIIIVSGDKNVQLHVTTSKRQHTTRKD